MFRSVSNKKLSVGEVYGFLFALLYLSLFFYGASHVEVSFLLLCVLKFEALLAVITHSIV